jgi:hypothetical protein
MEGNGTVIVEEMKKLRGYEFYKAIGSPKRVVAPMVDVLFFNSSLNKI